MKSADAESKETTEFNELIAKFIYFVKNNPNISKEEAINKFQSYLKENNINHELYLSKYGSIKIKQLIGIIERTYDHRQEKQGLKQKIKED